MGKISRYDVLGDDDKKSKKHGKPPKADALRKAKPEETKKPSDQPVSSKSSSNKLRDVKRALAKLNKKQGTPEAAEEAHVEALKEKIGLLEKRLQYNTENEAKRTAIKKQSTHNRKTTFLESRKLAKLFKKATTDEEKEELLVQMEYVKRFTKYTSGKIRYISLFDTKLSDEDKVKREDFLRRAREALEAKAEARENNEADEFFEEASEDSEVE